MSAEIHGEAGYLLSKVREGEWTVYKTDITSGEVVILAKYVVRDATCTCEGFQHRKDCRHVKMVYGRPKGVDRATARRDVQEIIASWLDRFDRITFDDYVFEDAEEQVVKAVKLKAHGRPILLDGVEHHKITGITRAGTFVEVSIQP